MRNFTLISVLVLFTMSAFAQNVLTYNFNNTLQEANGNGPELTVLGNQGLFMEDTLLEIGSSEKWVYRFEDNSGLQFDNSGFFGDSYTIEIYFVFDELNSWKRVIDWKNRKTDWGAYVYYGKLNFYNIVTSEDAPVLPGEYTYYVVTRDGATGQVLLYTDGEHEVGFTDASGHALVDADSVLNFFHDDLIVPNEASPGAVAMLRLYDYTLDSTSIKENFENLGSNVFSVKELGKKTVELAVYPNPASNESRVDLTAFRDARDVALTVHDMLGQRVFAITVNPQHATSVKIDVSSLPKGIYLIRADSSLKTSTAKLVVR